MLNINLKFLTTFIYKEESCRDAKIKIFWLSQTLYKRIDYALCIAFGATYCAYSTEITVLQETTDK